MVDEFDDGNLHARAVETVLSRDDLPALQLGGEEDSKLRNPPESSTNLVATLASLKMNLFDRAKLVVIFIRV
jgi:hypothetical protein